MRQGLGIRAVAAIGLVALLGFAAAATPAREPNPASGDRARVLVYYANETSEQASKSDNYVALLALLRRSPNPLAASIADSIEADVRRLPTVARRNTADLLAAAKRFGFDLAVFTNAMAFEGRYLFYRHAAGKTEFAKLPELAASTNAILATAPLARADYFRAALKEVAGRYPVGGVDVVLIANSHGTSDMALMPRVSTDLSIAGAAAALEKSLATGEEPDSPSWGTLQGTGKIEFWAVLAEASAARGVRFPLVFREACASGLRSWAEFRAVPSSVGTIAHSAMDNMDSATIDFAAIFAAAGPNEDWLAVLEAGLAKNGMHLDTKGTIWFWVGLITLGEIPLAIYFAPLALWLAWIALRGMRIRRRRAA